MSRSACVPALHNWSRRLTRQISLMLFLGLGIFSYFQLASMERQQIIADWDLRKALIYSNLKGLSAAIQGSNDLMRDENLRPLFRDTGLRSVVVFDASQKIIGGYALLDRNAEDVLLLPVLATDEAKFQNQKLLTQEFSDEYFGEVDEWGLFQKHSEADARYLSISVPLLGLKVNNQRLRLATLALRYDLAADLSAIHRAQFRFVAFLFSFALILLIGIRWALRSVEENMNLRISNEGLAARRHLMEIFAHDVRKPFQMIRTLRETLKATLSARDVRDLIEVFQQELDGGLRSVQSMIDDTLELASGRNLAIEAFSFRELLEESASAVIARHPRFGNRIHWNVEFEGQVEWDRSRINRVLWNLFENAFQAMKADSELFVCVSLKNDQVEFSIRNTLAEISAENLAKIFMPGFTLGRQRGTGLGLAIVRDLVERHHGQVNCESRSDGVVFSLVIPRVVKVSSELKNVS